MPGDPTDPDSLAQGGNFRVMTDHGVLVVLQRVPGIPEDDTYDVLAADAVRGPVFGTEVQVASLENLLAMKRAADRPVDRQEALG